MENLVQPTDPLTTRRIVFAFLDFLRSVEPSAVTDTEAVDVAADCLSQAFQLDRLPPPHRPPPRLLLDLFRAHDNDGVRHRHQQPSSDAADAADAAAAAVPKDELFGIFFDALERSGFFRSYSSNGDDRATSLFNDAVNEIESSGSNLLNRKTLADALKVLGNKAMQSNLYSDAIELYTCAIALCDSNSVYYCNRAAAYTQMHKYNEAIQDCLKAIEIDPNYSKAYSRMGIAYYAQGKYSDAINKGFRKALELDPNNDAVKENIRVAEQKLEDLEQRNRSQNFRFHSAGGSGDQAASSPFGAIPGNMASVFSNLAGNASVNQNGHPIDINNIPVDLASMVENLTRTFTGHNPESTSPDETRENEPSNPSASATASASATFEAGTIPSDLAGMFMNMAGQASEQGGGNVGGSDDDTGIPRSANFTFNFGGQTPEELNQAFSSMMGMFSGSSQGNPRGNTDGRPDAS